jgi:hypothetical protein
VTDLKKEQKYRYGDTRDSDDCIFVCYQKHKLKNGKIKKYAQWLSPISFNKRRDALLAAKKTPECRLRKKEYLSRPEVKRHRNQKHKNLLRTNPQFALASRVRSRISVAMRRLGGKNGNKTKDLIGCSFEFLKKHIESQFKEGMSWEDRSSFHIDHIKPLASFDLTDPEQLKTACHYTNLQPLSPTENMSKGARNLTTK